MAEWVPPTPTATATASRPPLPPLPPNLPTKPLSELEPPFRSETYIVQVPKDQIYRIPPPENAYLAEQYKNNLNRRRKSPCLTYLPWFLAVIAAIGLTIGIVALVFYLVMRPSVPEVSIESFTAKNLNLSGRWKKPEYDISMKTLNPSANVGYIYGSGGKARMSHKGAVIASGEPPQFDQPSHNESTFHLVLRGSSNKLPKNIERSLKEPKEIVALSLLVNYVVRLKIGVIELSKSMSIQCDFGVSMFVKGSKIVSQECSVKLGQ